MIAHFVFTMLLAQSINQDELLTRGRDRVLAAIRNMPRYMCTETVERSEFEVRESSKPKSCDQILADRANGISKIDLVRSDRLRLDVQVSEGGFEMYSWPGAARVSSERVQDFAGEGLMGTGSFGPFLIDVFANPGVRFWPEGKGHVDGVELRQYRYLVPLESSHYRVLAAGATRVIPYEGRFWLDPDSAEIRRLLLRTGELSRSTGNCQAETTADFVRTQIGSGEHLLPKKSVLHVVRRDAAEQENVTTYAACHEFLGEVAIHFGNDEPDIATPEVASRAKTSKFPPGVRVTLRFKNGINLATSAAGDILLGSAHQSERKPNKRLLPEAGAPVRCRIARQETDVRASRLRLAIACESIEWNSRWIPFAAVPYKGENLSDYLKTGNRYDTAPQSIQRRGYGTRAPSLAFRADQEKTGPLTLDWITVVPPKSPDKR